MTPSHGLEVALTLPVCYSPLELACFPVTRGHIVLHEGLAQNLSGEAVLRQQTDRFPQ
jgi:hypothetical protein